MIAQTRDSTEPVVEQMFRGSVFVRQHVLRVMSAVLPLHRGNGAAVAMAPGSDNCPLRFGVCQVIDDSLQKHCSGEIVFIDQCVSQNRCPPTGER